MDAYDRLMGRRKLTVGDRVTLVIVWALMAVLAGVGVLGAMLPWAVLVWVLTSSDLTFIQWLSYWVGRLT